jgi:hypothetical protein
MSQKIKIYWDYTVEELPKSLGGGKELNVHLYPKSEKPDLFEHEVDEDEVRKEVSELMTYAENDTDDDINLFEDIEDHDEWEAAVWAEMKRLGKIEEYFCGMVNGDGIENWEWFFEGVYDKACLDAQSK